MRRLAWALAILGIVSAVMALMFIFSLPPLPPPPPEIEDLVDRTEAWRGVDTAMFPFVFLSSLVTLGVFLVAAVLGAMLRKWASPSALRDAMVLLFVVGGAFGIAAEVLDIAVGNAATFGICDCNYRTEELISQDYALSLGWTVVHWLSIAAVTLTGIAVAVAGRLLNLSATWRYLSYAIAALVLLAVALRAIAAFVFVPLFDPFQVSDLLIAVAAGILTPIWAILLARGVRAPATEMAAS